MPWRLHTYGGEGVEKRLWRGAIKHTALQIHSRQRARNLILGVVKWCAHSTRKQKQKLSIFCSPNKPFSTIFNVFLVRCRCHMFVCVACLSVTVFTVLLIFFTYANTHILTHSVVWLSILLSTRLHNNTHTHTQL